MLALLTGDLDAAARARGAAAAAGAQAEEPDAQAIERTMTAGIARQTGDRAPLAREAALFEEFGTRERVPSIAAQAAVLWLAPGAGWSTRGRRRSRASSTTSSPSPRRPRDGPRTPGRGGRG